MSLRQDWTHKKKITNRAKRRLAERRDLSNEWITSERRALQLHGWRALQHTCAQATERGPPSWQSRPGVWSCCCRLLAASLMLNFPAPHFPYPKLGLSTNLAGFLRRLMKICDQCWTPCSCFYFYWCVWRAVSTSNCPEQQDEAYFFNCFYWTNNNYIPTLCLPCAGYLSQVMIQSDKVPDAI